MEVKRTGETRSYKIYCVDSRYKPRSGTITMDLEEDRKWHHASTSFQETEPTTKSTIRILRYGGELKVNNLADMVFIGKVAEEVIKIKNELNNIIPINGLSSIDKNGKSRQVCVKVSPSKHSNPHVHYKEYKQYEESPKFPLCRIIKWAGNITRHKSKVTCPNCKSILAAQLGQEKGDANTLNNGFKQEQFKKKTKAPAMHYTKVFGGVNYICGRNKDQGKYIGTVNASSVTCKRCIAKMKKEGIKI